MPAPLGFPGWPGPLGFLPGRARPSTVRANVPHLENVVSISDGETILLPLHKAVTVTIRGLDFLEGIAPLEDQRFTAALKSGGTAFASEQGVPFTVGDTDPLDPYSCVLTPTGLGSGKLFARADGDPDQGIFNLSMTFNVVVFADLADRLIARYSIGGQRFAEIRGGTFELPMDQVATVVMEGQDPDGNVVQLTDQDIQPDDLSKFTLQPTNPPNPNARLVVPVATGQRGINMSADGAVGSDTRLLQTAFIVTVVPAIATHLAATWGVME